MFSIEGAFFSWKCFFVFEDLFSRFFGKSEWVAKNREKKQEFSDAIVLLAILSPYGHLSSSYPSSCNGCIDHCFLALVVLFFLFSAHPCRSFFPPLSSLCSLFFILLFVFPAFTLCMTKKPDQITESPSIWMLFFMFCFGLWISMSIPHNNNLVVRASWHFHLAQIKTLKMVFGCLSLALNNVLQYKILQCFLNINQYLPKNAIWVENSPAPYRPPIFKKSWVTKNRPKSAKILSFVTSSPIFDLFWGLQCFSVL